MAVSRKADDRSKLTLIGDHLISYLLHRLRKGPIQRGPYPKEIGEILSLSPRTVSKHLEHIYGKLGIRTRTEAGAAGGGAGVAASLIGRGRRPP